MNLLADMSGWTIYQNENQYRSALGMPLVDTTTDEPTTDTNDDGSSSNDDFVESDEGIAVVAAVFILAAILSGWYWMTYTSKKPTLSSQDHMGSDMNKSVDKERMTELSQGPYR